jgi:inhibitor of KinA
LNELPVITPLSEYAVIVSTGNELTPENNERILAIFRQLQFMRLPGLRDLIPAFNTLTLVLDPDWLDRVAPGVDPVFIVRNWIIQALRTEQQSPPNPVCIEIPVCYNHPDTPDLLRLSDRLRLPPEEIIRLHTAATYRVYMLGFLPGFPYLGLLDKRLSAPRLERPRVRVPAGSVAIAGRQTGVYPLASPGGWNLIGKTSVRLYDPAREQPTLLRPGDSVRFIAVPEL